MKGKFFYFAVIAIALPFSFASASILKKNHPSTYTVKYGDTLWGISSKFLNNPWRWPSLWGDNPQIHNPNLIYPGDTLTLIMLNGKPRLQLSKKTVKLSPKMRVQKQINPIPPIPMKMIEPFLTKSRMMSAEQFSKAPYVLASEGERLIPTVGNKIYVRGLKDRDVTHYVVLQKDEAYFSPSTKKTLGIEARYVATVELKKFADPAILKVTAASDAINKGDRLFPVSNSEKLKQFVPQVPKVQVNAQIIGVLRGVTQIGLYNVVVINYGQNNGAKPGQVLGIIREGGMVKDTRADDKKIKLPNTKIGELMIFRCFNKVSFALVLEAKQAIRVLDHVKTPS